MGDTQQQQQDDAQQQAEQLLLSRIEDASINASAPPQQRWMDGWIVRTSPGKAKRARCINAVAPGRLPPAHKLDLARALYAAAGLPMVVRITPFSAPARLDAQLQALGYGVLDDTRVMLLRDLHAACAPLAPLPDGLHWQPLDHDAFAEAVGALRGSSPQQRQAQAQRLTLSPVPYGGFAIVQGRRPTSADGSASTTVLACGQIAQDNDLVGIYDVFTRPSARGQGLAMALCQRLLQLAAEAGARQAYLQVESDNQVARHIYQRLGFADAYSYHYRVAP